MEKETFDFNVTWDKDTIYYDRSLGRNDGIYSDTVLWGMAINNICNPTFRIFLEELSKSINQVEVKKEIIKYNYKSRWHSTKLAWTVGSEEAEKIGLGKSYKNWSPLLIHCYHIGVITGTVGVILSYLLFYIFYLIYMFI